MMAQYDLSHAVAVHVAVNTVYCSNCEIPYEPFDNPSFEGPNFCSVECEDEYRDR